MSFRPSLPRALPGQVLRSLQAPRTRAVLALGATVLLLHAALLALLPRTPGRGWHDVPTAAAQAMRVTAVRSASSARAAPQGDLLPTSEAATTAGAPTATPVVGPTVNLAVSATTRKVATATRVGVGTPATASDSRAPSVGDTPADTALDTSDEGDPQDASARASTGEINRATADLSDPGGLSVPVYATQLPPPLRLLYAMRRGGQRSNAELLWLPAGDSYTLLLQAPTATTPATGLAPARPTGLAWSSEGRIDADGIAPTRYTESRRGRPQRAVNFQRDGGRITFSGPTHTAPLLPGAQDRLSWMLQLAGVLAANPALAQPGRQVLLFVAGTRGDAEVWTFDVLGTETIELEAVTSGTSSTSGIDGSPVQALHLQRLPRRPYDTVVDVWLDPARHHLPVRTQLHLRTGGVDGGGTEFVLQALRLP